MMDKSKIKEYELKLLAGLAIDVEGIQIKSPTLLEIAKIGDDYNYYLSLVTADIKQFIGEEKVKENNISDEDCKKELLNFVIKSCLDNPEFHILFFKALSFFVEGSLEIGIDGENAVIYVKDDSGIIADGMDDMDNIVGCINSDNYPVLQDCIRMACCVKEEKKAEYNPANEAARLLIEKIEKANKNKPKTQEDITIHSITSSVAWKANVGIDNVVKLTIYQLYDAYFRLNIVDNYDKTMVGVYSGNIKLKSHELKKINWSQVIDLKQQ